MFVARALRPHDGVVILANAALRSRRQFGKGREFDNVPVTICPRQFRRHSPESHQLRAFGARVARVQRDSWDDALGPAAPVAGCAFARFAVPQCVILGALAADYAVRVSDDSAGLADASWFGGILATPLLVIMELAGLRSGGDARECARAELHRQI